jgi:protein tyrosine/serine phosphatase
VEGCKSNKWVAELVRDKCEAEPLAYLRLGDKQAKEVDAYFQNLSPQALQRAIAYLKDKTFMLFDDGSYSGTQLQEHISHLLEIIKTHQIKIKAIAVVVPFMTRHAELTLRAIPHQDTQVIISKHETIDTLDEIQEADTRQFLIRAWFKNDTEILKKMGLIWLEHKVPNDQSFPAPLASGSIYDETGNPSKKCIGIIPQIIPPYKKSEKLKNTQNIHRVYSWLFRGGKPNDLEVLLKEQISHVINLQEKQDLHFSADLKKENIEEKHIPFDIEKPNDDLVSEYLSFLCFTQKNIKNPKFYIHCFHGSDRTGMLVAITKVFYKIQSLKGTETDKDLEDTKSEAIKEMLDEKYGFHKISNSHLIEYVSNLNVGNLKDQVVEKIKKLTQAKQTDYFDQEQLKMKKAVNFNYAVKPKD